MSLEIEQRESEGSVHQSGKVNIVVNLKEVSDIDSAGLGALVFGLARLRKAGGRVALVNRNRSEAAKRFDILNFVQHKDARNSNYGAGSALTC